MHLDGTMIVAVSASGVYSQKVYCSEPGSEVPIEVPFELAWLPVQFMQFY